MEINIGAVIVDEELAIGDIELDVVKLLPELEDLEVTPSAEEQNFKSNKYGYNNVTVKAVETEKIEIVPSTEQQVETGLFSEVKVVGDENLVAENIKKDVEIFGVKGVGNMNDAKITNGDDLFANGCRTDTINELLQICDKITSAYRMFYNCKDLTFIDISNLDTSRVTSMSNMFYNCRALKSLDISNWNTSNVTTMHSMFYYCSALESLNMSNLDTSNVTNMYNMFAGCFNLVSIGELDAGKVTDITNAIPDSPYYTIHLTNLGGFKNLGKAYNKTSSNYSAYTLDLEYAKNLTHESLMNVINNLYDLNLTYDVANGGTLYRQSLVLGSKNLVKLTAEEIAIATNKGWNVS